MLLLIRWGRDSAALRRLDRPAQALDILFYQRDDGSFVLHRVKEVTLGDRPGGADLPGLPMAVAIPLPRRVLLAILRRVRKLRR